jgi:hypothetical protein
MKLVILLAASAVLAASPTGADEMFGGAAKVSDAALQTMRGGVALPGGLNVAIGIAIETRVDGQLALRTQFSTETSGIQVYAGGAVTGASSVAAAARTTPSIQYDRNAIGTTVVLVPATTFNAINVGSGIGNSLPATTGTALPVSVGGPGVFTALGTVRLLGTATGNIAELAGPDLVIQQAIGQATGAIVANSANNRAIDTATFVSINVRGAIFPSGLTSSIESVAQAVANRSRF